MAIFFSKHSLFHLVTLALALGICQVHAGLSYDHSFTAECLKTPLKPQYQGGIVVNPEFDQELEGWKAFGHAKIKHQEAEDGNNYAVASTSRLGAALRRNTTFHSIAQDFQLDKNMLYAFSAWFQVRHGEAHIKALIKPKDSDLIYIGRAIPKEGCWSMLKGGFIVNVSGPATLYFEADVSTAQVWVDSVSLQPFTEEEWKSHQQENVEKARKSKVKFQAVDKSGQPMANATVSIKQIEPSFPLGCAMNQYMLNNTAYRNWFLSRFKYTVFENELKWSYTETTRGNVNYTISDAMLEFAKEHDLIVRGHTVFWANEVTLPEWIKPNVTQNRDFFRAATDMRMTSVMNRYKGQFIHWDVVNENLHFTYFEDMLGPNASVNIFKKAHEIDAEPVLFLNDYFSIEKAVEKKASPLVFLRKIAEFRENGYDGPLGIGLQSHFRWVSPPFIRASLDIFATTKLPIWVTELDISPQAEDVVGYFEKAMRELHSHPGIEGMLLWSAWEPGRGCWRMCLMDDNMNNLPQGDVFDKILDELKHEGGVHGMTDAHGYFETSLFHGEYEAQIAGQSTAKSPAKRFLVLPTIEQQDPVHLKSVS